MRTTLTVLLAGLLLAACSTDTNPLKPTNEYAGPEMSPGGSLSKKLAANDMIDFEDLLLLDKKTFEQVLKYGYKSFQLANEKFDLYPGVVFSSGLRLGYISKPDPNRPGGQLYLYGSALTTHTVSFDQPARFTAVAARYGKMMEKLEEKKLIKKPILTVTGTHNNGNGSSEYSGTLSSTLTVHPVDFKHKITVATFTVTGTKSMLILDDFDFGGKGNNNNAVVNTKLGFEDLLELDAKTFKDVLKIGHKSFQLANDKYGLYPGIVFSKDFRLGYDPSENPGLGGRLYLYSNIGSKSWVRFLDGYVDFKSVYARVLDPKFREPITLRLHGYGDDKQKWAAEVMFLDDDLEKDLPKFDGEVNLIYFLTSGKAKQYVLDDFKFKE